jgi:hypothetical protein
MKKLIGIMKFIRDFLFGFLITWFAMDMWNLSKGNIRPLWRKGIDIEWLVNTKQNEKENDRLTFVGLRVTYTYTEPAIIQTDE